MESSRSPDGAGTNKESGAYGNMHPGSENGSEKERQSSRRRTKSFKRSESKREEKVAITFVCTSYARMYCGPADLLIHGVKKKHVLLLCSNAYYYVPPLYLLVFKPDASC